MAEQKITTFLWFDHQAEEAAAFYTSVFPGSRVVDVQRYGEAGPGVAGTVMTVTFELAGQRFIALNGGPLFPFTEAISLQIDCDSQAEVDAYWAALTEGGGQEVECGWLKDRYGLSWQVVPKVLMEMISDPDPERSARVTRAMLGMRKLNVQGLRDAYEGGGATPAP
ncbi:VOC family protein [Kitasatospora paracochleata]|uniref:3-demethylubiquinone-9 3-methyltransferase (Glyoxalase superfamily) n=1 Tax=Kitasatospora paracochleata TaxID=58354 RepID=A0ABT1ITX1_9ACTN|nr:VOC family protein [Kitasatospora paracochleata]MCP2308587.1 putative 3-demethylubiquinone-9 3-methyltransferase (glyoxalase superfamily) [Kitasatospora paracochleata]